MSGKECWAKWVRILTTPQISAIALVSLLVVQRPEMFRGTQDYSVSIFFLGIFPLLAYPIARIIPTTHSMGRKAERGLAFIFCLLGYLIVYVYGLCFSVDRQLFLLFETYFFSGLILAAVNVCFHIKASGHACGTTGAILLAGSFLDWKWSMIFALVFLLSAWASITLERHTVQEFMLGSICCVGGFAIGWFQNMLLSAVF